MSLLFFSIFFGLTRFQEGHTLAEVFQANRISVTSIGCYYDTNPQYILSRKDKLVGDQFQLMPYYSHKMTIAASPQHCAQHCVSKGFMFVALKENSCSCGDTDQGLIEATSHSIDHQCSHRCPGDSKTECGGKNVISLYKAVPSVRTQFPSRCPNGVWRLILNESSNGMFYSPDVTKITNDKMLWRATNFEPGIRNAPSRISMSMCTYKCETIPTCWGIILQIKPGSFRACALLDKPTTLEAKKILVKDEMDNREELSDINYGLQVWSCETMLGDQGKIEQQGKRGTYRKNSKKPAQHVESNLKLTTTVIFIINLVHICFTRC